MIKKYRKKPVVVEAMIFTGHNANEVDKWINGADAESNWGHCDFFTIETLEGDMNAQIGDYIIKGIEGEFYPCKPSVFAETYEEVNK